MACHADTPLPLPAPVATSVAVVSGDLQQADPDDALASPIVFRVLDAEGRPMAGIVMQLSTPIGGGSVPAVSLTTDSTGTATTPWTMGPSGGVQTLEARIDGMLMATATATTCDPAECFLPARLGATLSDASLLKLATYDSSGQAVHPDIVRGHGSATGFWMAITPYPGGNSFYENPSIFRSSDAANWVVPAGATNPLVKPESPAYLSDPDIVVSSDQKLWMYYRAVSNSQNIIKLIRSGDGVHWDSATTVITAPSHQIVSPAVVRGAPGAPWQMWSVNAGDRGCAAPTTSIEHRVSKDGIRWSAAEVVGLEQPGQAIWHIDVQWIPARGEYWALYNTYPAGSTCATSALYLARSTDGMTWSTYPSPVARAGVIPAFRHLIYRSSFMTNPRATQITLWLSGAEFTNNAYVWRTASVTTSVADILAIVSAPATLLQTLPFLGRLPPPEPDVGH